MMMKLLCRIVVLISFLPLVLPAAAREPAPLDRVEIKGGAVIIGQMKDVSGDVLRIRTSYAGLVEVELNEIERIVPQGPLPDDLPKRIVALAQSAPAPEPESVAPSQPAVAAPRRPTGPPRDVWAFETGLNLTGTDGNTDRFDLLVTAEAVLQRERDRIRLYGQFAYGENRGSISAKELILGGRYSNFFRDGLGYFVREELERDDFEGILLRSTTASGLILKLRAEEHLKVEGRGGLSYRYEDYKDDGFEDYPGMDFGLDLNWRIAQWVRFKGSYTYLPSIRDIGDFIIDQDSGLDLPLDTAALWKLRLGIQSKYNSQPDDARLRLDHRYYARLIAAWP